MSERDVSSEAVEPRATRLSGAMHRCLFEEAADGIIIADAASARFVEVNPRAEELTGYSREELLSMGMADLIAPESLAEQSLRWEALREDRVIVAERLIRRKDGCLFLAELTGRRVSDGKVVGFVRDISQRKKLQAELSVSEARYRSAVTVAPDAIAQVGLDGQLHMVSPSTLRLFGCAHEQQLLGRRLLELVAPHEQGRALALFASYRAGAGANKTEPLWLQRQDGQTVLCEVSAAPVLDAAGSVVSHALFARDITERSRTEARIQHLSRLYALLSHVNQAVIRSRERRDLFQTVCDVAVEHGGFRMAWIGVVDEATQRVRPVAFAGDEAGYLKDIVVTVTDSVLGAGPAGRALRDARVVVSDDIARDPSMAPWREAALARGYSTVASVPLCVKGRSVATLLVYGDRVGVFCDEERRLMQELGEDISAALTFMEAQADRRRAELAVRASEERFRSLVQNSMDAITLHAADGSILYCSPAVLRILGYGPDELMGTDAHALLHPDERDQAKAELNALLAAQGRSIKRDRRYRHRDGSYRWIESVATNLLHVPSVAAIVHNFRDVTERMRADEERQQLLAELSHAQKLDSLGRLAGGVAHDFNNMLAVILGSAEVALNDLRTPTAIQGYLREIRDAATRSSELTRQLLMFARKQPSQPKVIDVNRVVEGALKLLRRLIGEKVELQWKPGAAVGPVEMDPTQLSQILTNLTVNARDAILGHGTATIETGNCTFDEAYCSQHVGVVPGDYVRLTVSDTGVGISPDVQSQIFEPFFTTKGPGRGTGLGLATVYGIVKQYNGCIRVSSPAGVGSRFDIFLPRHVSKSSPQPSSQTTLEAAAKTAAILVVEDEPRLLSLVTTLLRNLGYVVLGAPTPQAALDSVRGGRHQPDLLLTDVVMPSMNGIELARALRAYQPTLRTIFMSGYVAESKANAPEEAVILHKPFTLKALAECVRSVLHAREPER